MQKSFDTNSTLLITYSINQAIEMRHEFVTPAHVLCQLTKQAEAAAALRECGADPEKLFEETLSYMEPLREYYHREFDPDDSADTIPDDADGFADNLADGFDDDFDDEGDTDGNPEFDDDGMGMPSYSVQMTDLTQAAAFQAENCSADEITVPHIIDALFGLPESDAAYLLMKAIGGNRVDFMRHIISSYESPDSTGSSRGNEFVGDCSTGGDATQGKPADWHSLVTCVNDLTDTRNPLIGRKGELERTVQVLCRRDKNNPLHIGHPGVGKTALVYGLARMIEEGDAPRLAGARIYQVDMGSLVSGTQFRGDFEKKVKMIMDGAVTEGNSIIYIDEIHTMVGAGATSDGSLDASNMLKPYLEAGAVRFIGATTYEEYNRHLANSKSLVRRFQQIDVAEPSVDEAVRIAMGLKPAYERFHGVEYTDEAVSFAVSASARHITDRYLPDKAIDLLDEAGAYREIHPDADGAERTVDKTLIADILAKTCKVDALAIKEEDTGRLESLATRIRARIYGQDEAVARVTEAVQMAKAGLTDESRPLASPLFVGPTGVGKTEVAKVLAEELGVELLRFDMSEYMEKHAVAKLIGAPAGYVGYEDGGQLTDAVRRAPDCVLLLDEIEKAHPDIFNILLQVMDYGRLTDNKGRHADFRNVVLIMTSNAGARYASQASLGFARDVSPGNAMLGEVRKLFRPEFINRLSASVVFNDMDRTMAGLILDKKLRGLSAMLDARKVELRLSEEARELLLRKGFTREYGGREIDRVIASMLKPLLMREILFGALKKGGTALAEADGESLTIRVTEQNQ